MERRSTTHAPSKSGWYFFKADLFPQQLAWIDRSGTQWHALIRYNALLPLSSLSNAEFDGPLNDPNPIVDRNQPVKRGTLLAELQVIDHALE